MASKTTTVVQAPDDLQDTKATADLLHTTASAIYVMRTRGQGPPAYRVGRRLLFSRSEVLAWIAKHREDGSAGMTTAPGEGRRGQQPRGEWTPPKVPVAYDAHGAWLALRIHAARVTTRLVHKVLRRVGALLHTVERLQDRAYDHLVELEGRR